MRPTINVLAEVQLEYDDTTGIARWTFRSLDPMTLLETSDPTLGFLPANYNGDGIGQVDFLINRKHTLRDSTIIDNRAYIVFDNEDPIATSTWRNTMDITPPISSIDSVTFAGGMATIAMNATDNLSGVWRYHVYAQENTTMWQRVASDVPADTVAVFVADTGTYTAFRTTAIDSAGNEEALVLLPPTITVYDTFTVTACDSYAWFDSVYTTTGEYMRTRLSAAPGEDDTVTTLYLTVNYSNTATDTLTTCDSLTWHGQVYTASTSTPTFTTQNTVGCDSVITLHLTVNYSNTATETLAACDSLTWHGSTYTASTSTPTFDTLNVWECDSTVTLNLTIHYSVHDTLTETAVDSFLWDGRTLTESGIYSYEGLTVEGCDSIVVLNLIVTHDSTFIDLPDGRDIRVYPNPTSGWLTIEAENVMEVRVFDNQGKLVKVFRKTNPIDLTDLPTGQYLLHVFLHDGSGVKKVIKR